MVSGFGVLVVWVSGLWDIGEGYPTSETSTPSTGLGFRIYGLGVGV